MMQDTGYKIRDLFIKMYDVSGKEVFYELKQNKVKDETVKIDTKSLPSGVYFVCIVADNERVFKKAVKLK
jgi:sugar/nucleoside kinase (ribokinase family)